MPKCYAYNRWIFTLIKELPEGGYYKVTDNNGRTASDEHFFLNISEMQDFVDNNGGCGCF